MKQLLIGCLAAVTLSACGSGVKLSGGKEGAAAALFAASGPTAGEGSPVGGGFLNMEFSVPCPLGGKAIMKNFGIGLGMTGSSSTTFTMAYDGCAVSTFDNPKTEQVEQDKVLLGGSLDLSQSINFSGGTTGGNAVLTLKGKVDFGGALDDYLEADISQTVDWSKLGTTTGSVSLTLHGTLKTSTASYSFEQETLNITAGTLIAERPEK
jgi:hypothetical protein